MNVIPSNNGWKQVYRQWMETSIPIKKSVLIDLLQKAIDSHNRSISRLENSTNPQVKEIVSRLVGTVQGLNAAKLALQGDLVQLKILAE